jgi:hypothetical protein
MVNTNKQPAIKKMSKVDRKDLNSLKYTIASEPVGTTWPFEDFVRMHGEYDALVMADSRNGVLEYGIFGKSDKQIVVCVSDVVKKYSEEEFEKNRQNLEVVVLDSGMYCVCPKWKDIPLYEEINKSWSLLEFAKAHGKMQVGDFKDRKTGAIFKACVFTMPSDGTRTFVAFSSSLGELTPKEITAQKDELYVAQLKSGNYSLYKKKNNDWEDVVLDDSKRSGMSKLEEHSAIDVPKETLQSSRRNGQKDNWMNLNEIKKEAVSPYASLTTFAEIQESSTQPRRKKNVHPPKGTKPSSIHYQAAFLAMLIAVVLGISGFCSNMIRLEQDRVLFLVMCCILSIAAWGYPYFETSVKVDNDGCFEQGCIHPIIGIFGILFFPLFIHYWLYKGIKACVAWVKKNCSSINK